MQPTPHVITVRNVNTALQDGLLWLATAGYVNGSRNGPVLVAPGPVLTAYLRPCERVLFSPLRDANPFFHLYECIWMMAGCNDAASVANYARTMDMFAKDGILTGAYGHRWRKHFGFDQLVPIIELLRKDPKTRRAVLSMWDPVDDLGTVSDSLDVPCNTAVYFDASTGFLNMTVTNRSNDIVWGAYGANSVHMSFLQEFIAAAIGMPVGVYYQFSNNYHTYVERPDVARLIEQRSGPDTGYNVHYQPVNRYAGESPVKSYALSHSRFYFEQFLLECGDLVNDPTHTTRDMHPFLAFVFVPMMRAHKAYKQGDYGQAFIHMTECQGKDWQLAGLQWLQRREDAKNKKAGAV